MARHYRFREFLPVLLDKNPTALYVYDYLDSRRNIRGRAFPKLQTIAKELKCNERTVRRCLDILLDYGALRIVAYKERVGEEKKVHRAQKIYEFTGNASINGKIIPLEYDQAKMQHRSPKARPHWIKRTSQSAKSLNVDTQVHNENNSNVDTHVQWTSVSHISKDKRTSSIDSLQEVLHVDLPIKDSLSTPADAVAMDAPEKISEETPASVEPIAKTSKAKERDTALLGMDLADRLQKLKADSAEQDSSEWNIAPPPPRVSKGMKATREFKAMEHILMHTSHPRKADGFLLADVLRWLYLEVQATPMQVIQFLQWYHKKMGDQYGLPKKLAAWQGDGLTDKGRWADWLQETKPKSMKPKVRGDEHCPICGGLGKISVNVGTRYKVKMEYPDCECVKRQKAVA